MKTNFEVMETNFNGMVTSFNGMLTNLDNLELQVLNENEMNEINGGAHYEFINGKIVWVND